ncbi:MAG: DUF1559 domain-containing protein [Planctomycetota bacterium]
MVENPYRSPDQLPDTSPPTVDRGLSALLKLLGAVFGIGMLLYLLLAPMHRGVRTPARANHCRNNLRNIGLALHSYHDAHGAFPPAYTVDADGNRLHSWRTLILPFIEQQALYEQIDLTKPWDDPANAAAREVAIDLYQCPSSVEAWLKPSYVVVVDGTSLFSGAEGKTFADIKDGTANTIAIVEMHQSRATHWMEPVDATMDEFCAVPEHGHATHPGVFQAAFADAHASAIANECDPEQLRALVTIAGGERITDE